MRVDHSPVGRLRRAARELGLASAVSELPATAAADVRRRTEERFLHPGMEWWFERLKSGRSYWNTSRGWYAVEDIAEMVVDAPVWLMPVYDDNGDVFRAQMPVFVDILHQANLTEFALVSPDLSWLLMVDHHNCLYGVGDRVEAHLARIKRRVGGNGAVVKSYFGG